MSQQTRNLIIEKTVELARFKPIRRITINEIVKACGITRNSFYYYFHDIYSVFEAILDDSFKMINWEKGEEAVFDLFETLKKYKHVWINLYRHADYDLVAGVTKGKIRDFVILYFNKHTEAENISEHDLQLIYAFYEEALFGLITRCINSFSNDANDEKIENDLKRLRILFNGQLDLLISNAKK